MKTFLTLFAAALLPLIGLAQAEVEFNVDMACAPEFETVFVTGPWCGWCAETGDNVLTDDDGDGVYSVTLGGFDGTVEYKYAINGFAGQEDLVNDMAELGASCAPITDNTSYANRTIEAGSVANDFYGTCNGTCNDDVTPADSFDVTFRVDMSEYAGSYSTVNLNGSFNGWCGTCAEMLDEDGDGIYALTVNLPAGTVEYKFTLDGWTEQEMFDEGAPCTSTIDGYTNRTLDVAATTTLDAVCYDSCDLCEGSTGGFYSATFQVDMSEYSGTYTNVHLNGVFNGWCGECAPMSDDDGDMVYTLTVDSLEAGTYEYKFTLDGWTMQEEFAGGEPCTSTIDGFTNRTMTLSGNTTLDVVCYNSCEACGVEPEVANVTFHVDMNQEDILGPIYVTGETIDGWCGTCVEMMDDDGDGIYSVTVELAPGTHEFKFNNGGWDGTENLDPVEDADCTLTTDEFTNRVMTFEGTDAVELEPFCFNACTACIVNVAEVNGPAFNAYVDASGQIVFQSPAQSPRAEVTLTDLSGAQVARWIVPAGVSQQVLTAPANAEGIYLIAVTAAGQRSVKKLFLTH